MQLSCIAVDDEPLALELIEDYIGKTPSLNLLKSFDNAIDAMEYLKNEKIDLIFLDIQMEELTGIQMLNIIKQKPMVIFTTAYDNFALKGYELDIVDYLLKPISFERFLKAADKAIEKFKLMNMSHIALASDDKKTSGDEDYFFVKTEFRLRKVNFEDILYIEGMGDYLRIITNKEKIMTLQNFKKMEEILPPGNFARVHKSYIVSVDKIISIEKSKINIGDISIPISETYKKTFYDLLEKKKVL